MWPRQLHVRQVSTHAGLCERLVVLCATARAGLGSKQAAPPCTTHMHDAMQALLLLHCCCCTVALVQRPRLFAHFCRHLFYGHPRDNSVKNQNNEYYDQLVQAAVLRGLGGPLASQCRWPRALTSGTLDASAGGVDQDLLDAAP